MNQKPKDIKSICDEIVRVEINPMGLIDGEPATVFLSIGDPASLTEDSLPGAILTPRQATKLAGALMRAAHCAMTCDIEALHGALAEPHGT